MNKIGGIIVLLGSFMALGASSPSVHAQGSRKDDIVFGPSGHPVAGATIRICQSTATGAPCSPLATIYTDATMATTSPNPFQSDGIGNYHFYAPAGRYVVQITGPGINGTQSYPDVILPTDVSTAFSGDNISAFSLALGGNLSVAGNATINGTLSTTTFSPASFAPSSLSVGGDGCFAGPRPHIDITCAPYNAKGNGSTDDTAAITAAISAACALGSSGQEPTVYFPPGTYKVSQAQGGSGVTTPIFTGCSFLRLQGGGGTFGQFSPGGESQITVSAGSNPDAGPVIAYSGVQNPAIENLAFGCYNQCVAVTNSSSDVRFRNVSMGMLTTGTGMPNNTPLYLQSTIWVWWAGGFIDARSNSVPPVLMTNSGIQPTALVYFSDLIMTGGPITYSLSSNTNPTGVFVFRNITREASTSDFFDINANGFSFSNAFGPVEIDNFSDSDAGNGSGAATINFNASGTTLYDAHITSAQAGGFSLATLMPSIKITAGNGCSGCTIDGRPVTDSSGNPMTGASALNAEGGTDYISSAGDASRLRSDLTAELATSVGNYGPGTRYTPAGGRFAGVGIDAIEGLLFGDATNYGFNAGIRQGSGNDQTIDVTFSTTLPPTAVTGTAVSGGSIPVGTYYYFVVPSTNGAGDCSQLGGAPSRASAAVTTTTGNQKVNLSWTNPSGFTNPHGFCVIRGSIPFIAPGAQIWSAYVSSSTATSFTDDGTIINGSHWWNGYPVNTMAAAHRFTETSLGINTTNPQFNLDVNGSAEVNSLNSVQMAERFSGADASAKINACLTAASTTSGVCDARGLTGTLTGSTHIQIPAGTTLFWGRAQLTINDTTNNDAVELMGDGSALIGYQESGTGTVPRPDSSGYIACQPAGCTAVKNPNAATRNVDWVHITGMNLQATGASSAVLNLTSVGHADIENNRLVMGTGGGSYGIFGDTSTGGFDSTNTLIKHNEFDPQFQNDRCLHLAGIFNVIEMEQNTCILPASNTGTVCFEIAKDSNGNYPNNDEFYGNDCEGSSTSFGQIGYNIINADSVTIGPNNRCENVYNCFQFPTDGSAVGIHVLDPYISVSANSVVKPNEPSTAQIAIDNNGPNWLPSMHYGFNDLGGRNLLGNAAFEGWANSTTLYYWGGVSGTNINQAGSGIYAQNSSTGTPSDGTTQGSYNIKIGDNATAGLGINSGCISVDATMNYTFALRIASSSTSINFRPGFRFYSDPNCTEADKITNVATNARILTPANYAGQSAVIGTGTNPNWQSTNASLTYNNGITCNCNVTGADWNVAAANTWTPTRNFAITFRVPNAYSSTSTVAQSMRVFILENTAANPNQILVDDAVLSEGPVSPTVPLTAGISDSINPTVYGNLAVNGSLTVGASALPAALTSGTPTANDCAAFTSSTVTNIQDSGSACPAQLTKFSMGTASSGQAPSGTNAVDVSLIYLPNIQFSKLAVDVSTTDSSSSDFYSWAITDLSGSVKCSVTAVNLTAGGASDQSCTQGTVTLSNGAYIFAFTGNATMAKIAYSGTAPLALSSAVSSSTSSSGAMTFPISIPSAGVTYSSYGTPAIILH